MPERVRTSLLGYDGLIQRTARLTTWVAVLSAAAVILPPAIGLDTAATLTTMAIVAAGVLGHLSWIHNLVRGLSPAAKRRRRRFRLAVIGACCSFFLILLAADVYRAFSTGAL